MTDLSYDEFMKLFWKFEHTVFQYETRESYAGVADDAEFFRQFLAGRPPEVSPWEFWYQNVRAQTAVGKRFVRVRVVSEPWSDYTRFGLWSGRDTVAAGEDIRYLSRNQAVTLGLPEHDYRMLDSKVLVLMHYDDTTHDIARREVVDDPATIVQHNYWRDAAWHYAVPLDEYVEQVGEVVVQSPAGA